MKVYKDATAWLLRHTKRQLAAVVLLSVLSMLTALAYLWLALLSKELLETAQTLMSVNSGVSVWDCLRDPRLYRPALTVVGVVLGQVALYALTGRLQVYAAGRLEMRLREQVFSSLLRAEYTTVQGYHSGELVNRMTSDITVVAQGVTGLLPSATSLLARLIGGLAVLAILAPTLALVIVGIGVLAIGGSRLYGIRLKRLHQRCQEAYGKTRAFVQELLGQLLSVRAFANETAVEAEMNRRQAEHFRWKLRRSTVQVLGSTGMYVLMTAAYYVMLLWCVFCVAAGTMTIGTLAALLQIFDQLQAPLRSASGLLPQYYAILASAERLQQIDTLPAEPSLTLPASRESLVSAFRGLQLREVSFSYDADIPVLRGVNLTVNRGDCGALVGPAGSGKSTLMKLILALYPCGEGRIILDGTALEAGAAARCLMSYVPQGNTLITGTLRENIAFFRPVSDEAVRDAIRLACLEPFVDSLPHGWDTPIGEHGAGVSEGQAQRIAIARALLHDAPLLLLDECTSALDAETEERLLHNLRGLSGKAVLLISHKDTTVAGCDRVWRLQNGTLHTV